jgi:uncharacterized protein (DUF1684 family)
MPASLSEIEDETTDSEEEVDELAEDSDNDLNARTDDLNARSVEPRSEDSDASEPLDIISANIDLPKLTTFQARNSRTLDANIALSLPLQPAYSAATTAKAFSAKGAAMRFTSAGQLIFCMSVSSLLLRHALD